MRDIARAICLITYVAGGVVAIVAGVLISRAAVASLRIDGNATAPLSLSQTVPVDVRFTNSYDFPLAVSDLRVRVRDVRAPHADPAHPCTAGDFVVTQVSSATRIRVEPRTTTSLSRLLLPGATWPRLGVVSGSPNTHACRGASLTLSYVASGSLRTP